MIRRISFGAKASHRERFLIHELLPAIMSVIRSATTPVLPVLLAHSPGVSNAPHVEPSEPSELSQLSDFVPPRL